MSQWWYIHNATWGTCFEFICGEWRQCKGCTHESYVEWQAHNILLLCNKQMLNYSSDIHITLNPLSYEHKFFTLPSCRTHQILVKSPCWSLTEDTIIFHILLNKLMTLPSRSMHTKCSHWTNNEPLLKKYAKNMYIFLMLTLLPFPKIIWVPTYSASYELLFFMLKAPDMARSLHWGQVLNVKKALEIEEKRKNMLRVLEKVGSLRFEMGQVTVVWKDRWWV